MRRTKSLPSADAFFMSLRQIMAVAGDKFSDPWTQNPFVRSGVTALYRIVRGVPFVGYVGDRNKPEEAKRLGDNDPLSVLVAKPNPIQSGGEFAASVVAYQALEGVAYVVMYGEGSAWWARDGKNLPREMFPLDPRTVAVEKRDDVTGLIRSYRIGGKTVIPAESIVAFREFNPRDLQAGSASLQTVWASMEADRLMDVFSAALLENGASPGTVLKLKSEPSASQRKDLREQFDARHGGAKKAGRTVVVGQDMDLTAFPAQTAKDMEATASRDMYRDRIKAVLGVTDYEVGQEQDYSRAASENARAWLWTNTVLPTLASIADQLWSHVFEPLSRGQRQARWADFDLSKVAALRKPLGEAATTAATLIATGFDPVQVSEKLELGLDFVEIDEPEPPPPPPVVAAPPPPPVEPTKSGPYIWTKRDKPSKPSRAFALRIQHQWADQAERRLGVKWRKFTGRRYAETIRLVRNLADVGPVSPSVVETIMGDAAAWREGAKAAAEAGLKGSGARLVDNFGAELGGFRRIDVGQEAYQVAAARRVGQMVEVGTALRRRIQGSISRAIADAGTDGVSVDALEKVLQQRFAGVLPSNAATVARTEVGMFSSDVRRSLMVAEGVDEHEWSASMDEHTRDDHRQVDGERRPIGTRFSNGLLYPLESGAPAAQVVNCRCVELPYLREAE